MNAHSETWNTENWQQLGDVVQRLVQEKARQRANAPSHDRHQSRKEMAMRDCNCNPFDEQSPAEWRETKRTIVFYSNDLHSALEQVVRYARIEIDRKYAINGMPRSVLPWRMPDVDLCDATAVLAAHYLSKGRESSGAEMITNAMFMVDTDSVIDGLCVAEDLALVTDNFTERFGEDA